MANQTSQHILNTSANLLGFCLIVISSLKIFNKSTNSYLDELTAVIAVFLTISSLFSFVSIKTKNSKREILFETVADCFFLIALLGLLILIVYIALNIM